MVDLSISGIRETFSKAGISIDGNFIFVVYAYKGQWFSQSIDGNLKNVFVHLLNSSREFKIFYNEGKSIIFSFVFNIDFDLKESYLPLKREMSLNDLKSMCDSLSSTGNQGFFEFFTDVDTENETEVMDAFVKYLTRDDIGKSINFNSHSKWKELKEICSKLCTEIHTELIAYNPDPGNNGSFIFYFPECNPVIFNDGNLKMLTNIIDSVDAIEFAGNSDDGILNLSLYP